MDSNRHRRAVASAGRRRQSDDGPSVRCAAGRPSLHDAGGFPNETFEIVGVAADSKYRRLRQEAQETQPAFYLPVSQPPGASMAARLGWPQVELRTSAARSGLETRIREVVREVDPAVAVTELRSMSAMIDRTIAQEKMLARLASWLGVLALVLGAIGIYGVRAYTVNQRAGEIGLRTGARCDRGAGLPSDRGPGSDGDGTGDRHRTRSAAALTRYVGSLLFGVTPHDPATFAVVTAVFIAVAVWVRTLRRGAPHALIQPPRFAANDAEPCNEVQPKRISRCLR